MSTQMESKDVRSIISENIPQAEMEYSDLAGGILVTVPDQQIGQFFGLVRRQNIDATSKRLDNNLVAVIEAEKSNTLGELFG